MADKVMDPFEESAVKLMKRLHDLGFEDLRVECKPEQAAPNLLRADYNIVGFGIARLGDAIYVVEDFGESVPTISSAQAEDAVATAIERQRQLKRLQLQTLRRAACSMASEDQINPKQVSGLGPMRYVLTYTNLQPESLPNDAERALADRKLRSFAVGTCYAQTSSYPNGAYFVAVAFY